MKTEVAVALLGAAALLGLALWQASALLWACGLRMGPLGALDFCPAEEHSSASAALAAEAARARAFEDRVRKFERRLAGLPACRPEPPPAPPPPPDPPRAETPPLPPPPESDGLDAEKWRDQDVALLEGCWSLSSDYRLRNTRTRVVTRVATWEMCFDEGGRGEQTLVQTDGLRCEGPVRARFQPDGRLRIEDVGDLPCANNIIVHERRITCQLEPGGEAACVATQEETGSRSNVRITRRASP